MRIAGLLTINENDFDPFKFTLSPSRILFLRILILEALCEEQKPLLFEKRAFIRVS